MKKADGFVKSRPLFCVRWLFFAECSNRNKPSRHARPGAFRGWRNGHPRLSQGVHIPLDGADGNIKGLSQLCGGGFAVIQQIKGDGIEPVGFHGNPPSVRDSKGGRDCSRPP